MAVMMPNVNPDDISVDSERIVYRVLKEQLPNDYVVLHSYPWLRPDRDGVLREGEADFIVLHQERGLLVLEVKGGTLRYQNATWQRKKSHGYEVITDPFRQARCSMHHLVERIEQRTSGDVRGAHFSYGYAVVFPHDDYTGDVPPGGDRALILSRRDMDEIEQAINQAMAIWPQREKPLTDHQWRRLTSALLPEFMLFRPMAVLADDLFERIQEMTDEQIEVVAGICDDNKRVFISGVAGSGKTQIAYDRAIGLAASGFRTLLVCYNKSLAEHLQNCLHADPARAKCEGCLTIMHFHGLARLLIDDAGIHWAPPESDPMLAEFFIRDVPDLMEQAIYLAMEDGEKVQYDAIVIDEAQDFHDRWWEVLECTLLEGGANGRLLAFADPVQKIWEWAPSEPPVSFAARYTLRRNCRNSKWIARTSAAIANTEAMHFRRAPLGGKPKVYTVASMASMKGIAMRVVEQLMHAHDLRPSQVVLIGPKSYEHGSLRSVSRIGGVAVSGDIRAWFSGAAILVTTSRSFKGLEADVVVLYDLEQLSDGFSVTDLYVACTRARSHIHFLVVGREMHGHIEEVLERVEQDLRE